MKRILKRLFFSLVSAGVVYIVLIGLCTYLFPELEKRREEDDDYDIFYDPDFEGGGWKMD